MLGIELVVGIFASAYRQLQTGDHVRVVHMVFAIVHITQQATVRQSDAVIPGTFFQLLCISLQLGKTCALNARWCSGKTGFHDIIGQANNFKQLRPAITANRADAHFRNDFQQAFLDATPVVSSELGVFFSARQFDHAAFAECMDGLIGQIRIHRRRAIADQAREMMRVTCSTGFDNQVAITTQAHTDQMLVHCTGHQQRMNRQLVGFGIAIGQNQDNRAVSYRLLCFKTQAFDRVFKTFFRRAMQMQQMAGFSKFRQLQNLVELALR